MSGKEPVKCQGTCLRCTVLVPRVFELEFLKNGRSDERSRGRKSHRVTCGLIISIPGSLPGPAFNEPVNGWYVDHVYKHEPNATEAFLLTVFLAYNFFHAFLTRNLKPQIQRGKTQTF
jgi:hypothetical protein